MMEPAKRTLSFAAIHRWAAIVLVAMLVVWSITGLLFHLKPGWDRAYDQLSVKRDEPLDLAAVAPIKALGNRPSSIELFSTVVGPLYRVSHEKGSTIVDAITGREKSWQADEIVRLVDDAVSRSPFVARYGAHTKVETTNDGWRVIYAGDQVVSISSSTLRISQEGRDTRRIDWLYRLHYLQWTGNKTLDKILAIGGLALIWIVMIPGVVLFVRRLRGR